MGDISATDFLGGLELKHRQTSIRCRKVFRKLKMTRRPGGLVDSAGEIGKIWTTISRHRDVVNGLQKLALDAHAMSATRGENLNNILGWFADRSNLLSNATIRMSVR